MAFSLPELEALAAQAGIPQPAGLPLRALIASVAKGESNGIPDGPAGDKNAAGEGTSFGLFQVHAPDWPAEAATVRAIIASDATDGEKVIAQIRTVAPIIRAAAKTAGDALAELRDRGFPVPAAPVRDFTVLFDAAWQHSPKTVLAWARKTKTGNPLEIDPRGEKFLGYMRELGAFGGAITVLELFVFLGGAALALWVLSQWKAD